MIRRACILAGILGLFLQGSNGGHMLLVEHSRCVEHGQLVHDGGGHEHAAEEHSHPDAPAAHGTPDAGSEEAHEHCALSIDRRDALVAIAAPLVSARCVEAPLASAVADALVVTGADRFRQAPKNSPPA